MKRLLVVLLFVFLLAGVCGDIGRKPTAVFDVEVDGQPVQGVFYAKMLTCQSAGELESQKTYKSERGNEDRYLDNRKDLFDLLYKEEFDAQKNCYWFPAWSAWGGNCTDGSCDFGYFLPSEFKLAVYIPGLNKKFVTGEIRRYNTDSIFEVNIDSASGTATITDVTSPFASSVVRDFSVALILTLFFEILVLVSYANIKKIYSNRLLASGILANIISLPVVWFGLPYLIKHSALSIYTLAAGIVFAIVFEAFFIFFLNRERLNLKNAAALSVLMNIVSMVIGGFIFLFLMSFFMF